jgi:hypothetical protein
MPGAKSMIRHLLSFVLSPGPEFPTLPRAAFAIELPKNLHSPVTGSSRLPTGTGVLSNAPLHP